MASDPWIQLGGVTGAFGLAGFVLKQVKPIITLYREALEDASTERGTLHIEVAEAKRVAEAASRDAAAAKQEAAEARAETKACQDRERDLRRQIAAMRDGA